jgi:hypothetical protein
VADILVRFLNKCEFSGQIVVKAYNIKFRADSSCGIRADYMRKDRQTDRQTADVTKLIVAFREYANASKIELFGIAPKQVCFVR